MIKEKDRALKNHVKLFEVASISKKDAAKQLYYTSIDVARVLEDHLYIDKGLKVNVNLEISMKKKQIDDDGEEVFIYSEPYFRCKDFTITNSNVITDALDRAAEETKNIIAGWLSEGSGWTIDEILRHYVNIV